MQFSPKPNRYWNISVILVSAMLTPGIVIADTDICGAGVIQLPKDQSTRSPQTPNPPVNITADSIGSPKEGLLSLQGNVQLTQGGKTMLADKILYHKNTKLFEAHNNVRVYSRSGDVLATDFLELDMNTSKGHTSQARFKVADRTRVHDNHRLAYVAAYGTAKKVIFNNKHQMQLLGVDYVNCLENKGDMLVSAKELKLNVDTGDMHAELVKVRILNPNDHARLIE